VPTKPTEPQEVGRFAKSDSNGENWSEIGEVAEGRIVTLSQPGSAEFVASLHQGRGVLQPLKSSAQAAQLVGRRAELVLPAIGVRMLQVAAG